MNKYPYYLVDVFTNQKFGGNPLAVFPHGQEVPVELMPKIAKELNLSETTFILPPQNPAHNFWVRIFTPAMELPMAGHPTVGTAFVLRHLGAIGDGQVIFEEGVGPIPVTLAGNQITMQQPNPTFGRIDEDYAAFAAMLSIEEADLDEDYPIQEVSCGVPFTFIPIKSLDAMRRLKLRIDLWEKLLKDRPAHKMFMFTTETEAPTSTVHSRMFAPGLGIAEDPATGGASGPLGSYLVKYGIAKGNPAQIISEQGYEMGRPSLIYIGIESVNEEISRVTVGGEAVLMGEGAIYA